MIERIWTVALAVGLLAIVGYALLAEGAASDAWFFAVEFGAVAAIVAGIRLHQPADPRAWWLLAAGLLVSNLGDVADSVETLLRGDDAPLTIVPDLVYFASYPLLAAGVVRLARARSAGRDRGALIDAAIIAVGAGLLVWVFVIGPYAGDPSLGGVDRLVLVAYPLIDVILLGVTLRLAFSPGGWSPALTLLGLGLAAMLGGDLGYFFPAADGTVVSDVADLLWLGFAVAWSAAALHPSMRRVAQPPATKPDASLSGRRLLLLAAASLLAPAAMAIQDLRGEKIDVPILAGGAAVLVLLVLLRLRGMVALADELQRRRGEDRFHSLVRHATDIIAVLDAAGAVRYVSPAVEPVLGHVPEEVVGADLRRYVHPDDRDRFSIFLAGVIGERGKATAECRLRRRDGAWRDLELIGTNLLADETVGGIVVNARDVSERKRAESMLAFRAYHDELTGLPNRARFVDRLDEAVARAAARRTSIAVLFLDLDGFKAVNDSLGHDAGDALLVEVSRRLTDSLRPTDTVARLGGDEFTILIDEIADDAEAVGLAARIEAALDAPFTIEHRAVSVGASIGVAVGRGPGLIGSHLLRDADVAMYRVKTHGKRGHCLVRVQAGDEAATPRLDLAAELRQAIERGDLEPDESRGADLVTAALR